MGGWVDGRREKLKVESENAVFESLMLFTVNFPIKPKA
jgi:hypothetical protein